MQYFRLFLFRTKQPANRAIIAEKKLIDSMTVDMVSTYDANVLLVLGGFSGSRGFVRIERTVRRLALFVLLSL